MFAPLKALPCWGVNSGKLCKCRLALQTFTKNSSNTSKIRAVLEEELPPAFNYIKEINRTNSKLLEEKYNSLLQRALAGGGERGIERHVNRNKKMLVRDRIKLLLDEGSCTMELSPLAGLGMEYGDVPCAGVVTMIGKVHGLLCMVIANDATVKSGSVYPITLKKQLRAQEIAKQNRLPCIYLVDSGGAFLPKQAEIFNEGGRSFANQAMMSASGIPQTAVVCGSCTAGGAYIPAMADEAVIIHKSGTIFLGGPPLVFAATGERVTAEQLGGATLHCSVSGVTDHFANDEEEALLTARDMIATLNLHDLTQVQSTYEEPLQSPDNLNDLAPSSDVGFQLDPHNMLACILDGSKFHEFKRLFGSTLVAGFGYIKGHLAGFLVSNGRLNGPAAVKGTHFVQLCSQRGIPLIFLQHFSKNSTTCHQSTINTTEKYDQILKNASFIKSHAQLMQAISCARVPSIAIATGGLVGSLESHALGSLAMGSRFQFTFPSVRVGGHHPSDMAHSAALDEIHLESDHSEMPPSFYKRKLALYESYMKETDAFRASANVLNDGVILPGNTRNVIASCMDVFKQEASFTIRSKQVPPVVQPMIRM